jgi:DNA-binding XRE family transcriptional regulator
MKRKTHKQLMKIAMARPGVKHEYEKLGPEFAVLNELLAARIKSGKTQAQVAKAMGTTTSVVGRLESSGSKKIHSPSITTLEKYAHAVNCTLKILLIPVRSR